MMRGLPSITTTVSSDCEIGRHGRGDRRQAAHHRSEEHTSELQSQSNIVCRLLLEKKKIIILHHTQLSLPNTWRAPPAERDHPSRTASTVVQGHQAATAQPRALSRNRRKLLPLDRI